MTKEQKITKEEMIREYWRATNKALWDSKDFSNEDVQTVTDFTNYLTRREFNITQDQLETMYYNGKDEVAMTSVNKEEVLVQEIKLGEEERKMHIKEEKRKHKEVLWNNKYYVAYKMLTVVAITVFVCMALVIGNK